jgi:hypothetical protein
MGNTKEGYSATAAPLVIGDLVLSGIAGGEEGARGFGREWIVDADLKDFFGSVDHVKLLALAAQKVADGRVLRLTEAMLKAGS